MPPKKRPSSSAEPTAKHPAAAPECHYAHSGHDRCTGELVELREADTGKAAMLCEAHRRCGECEKPMDSGKFALGHRQAICCLPFGVPTRLAETCAFRCARCKETLVRHFISKPFLDPDADNDPDILCTECWSKCRLCGDRATCRLVKFRDACRYVCRDCVPDISESHTVTIIPMTNREF